MAQSICFSSLLLKLVLLGMGGEQSCNQDCFRGLSSTFQSSIFEAWELKISAQLAEKRGSFEVLLMMSTELYNHLPLPT